MPLTLKKHGDIWHYSGTVAGQRIRRSAKTTQKNEAQDEANRVERTIRDRHRNGTAATLTFIEAAIEYRGTKGEPRYLEFVEDHWKGTPVAQINGGAIRKAALALLPKGSPAYRNRAVIVPTQAVINHCAELDMCAPVRVRRFVEPKTHKEPATLEWIEAFMAHASPHLGALACFMFATGARISEALGVTWGDVDLTEATVLIRMGKLGGAERVSNMPPILVAALANLGGRDPKSQVFPYAGYTSCKDPWKVAIRRAGIARLTPHCCRHGFATGLLHKGVDVKTIADLGGWLSAHHVLKTYGHAQKDKTLNNLLFDTPQADQSRPRLKAMK